MNYHQALQDIIEDQVDATYSSVLLYFCTCLTCEIFVLSHIFVKSSPQMTAADYSQAKIL